MPAAFPTPEIFVPAEVGTVRPCSSWDRYCRSGWCQWAKSLTLPLRVLAGVPGCCADHPQAELARLDPKMASPAQMVAARIKAEEAYVTERRAAVRYLATVNCHYYPEAEFALLAALRADRNDCVRYEAAMALATGCCRTHKVVEALQITVAGTDRDGNPPEMSGRVKGMAEKALQRCLALGLFNTLPEPPQLPGSATKKETGPVQLTGLQIPADVVLPVIPVPPAAPTLPPRHLLDLIRQSLAKEGNESGLKSSAANPAKVPTYALTPLGVGGSLAIPVLAEPALPNLLPPLPAEELR